MGITVNLRHLEKKNQQLIGELPVSELNLDYQDEVVHANEPLSYDIEVERLGRNILARGELYLDLECECVRCLKKFTYHIELPDWAADLPLEGEDQVPVVNDSVDLTPFIREDILLAFPQHPLCENECSGLPSAPQIEGQSASGANQTGEGSSAWAELNKLKF